MEFHFQNQDAFTTRSENSSGGNGNKRKYVGVRQRPSGKWVAEIKNTTQKIRMWLGTFDTAIEAAQAYDEAACLLRGSNTRTNFMNHVPCNPALALKIRNLLNQKKTINNKIPSLTTTTNNSSKSSSFENKPIASRTNINLPPQAVSISPPPPPPSPSPSAIAVTHVHVENFQETKLFDGAYKPDLNFFMTKEEKGSFQFDHSSTFTTDFDRILENEQEEGSSETAHYNKRFGDIISCGNENDQMMPDFEHLKAERQISASLYAMNGVSEYWENVNDSNDPFWHLPLLHQTFCSS